MKYIRVYLASDGQGCIGALTDKKKGTKVVDPVRKIWLNLENGIILDEANKGVWDYYSVNNIPFGSTFRPRFFGCEQISKTVNQIMGKEDDL
jgi:hypothetical protein